MNQTVSPNTLSERQAADYLGVSVAYLRKQRADGILPGHIPGPPYVKLARRVLYRRMDLDDWLKKHLIAE